MNINWQMNNETGLVIKTNGSVFGSGDSVYFEIPLNIKIVMSVKPEYTPKFTSAQVNTLRNILSKLPNGVIFNSTSPNLEELAISIYHGNRS